MHEGNGKALDRRAAMRLLATGVAGGLAGGAALPALLRAAALPIVGGAPRLDRIGLQLYTVRSVMAKDIEGTLDAIAKAGITELEFAGYYNKDAAWWRAALSARGLTAPATHEGMPATDDGWGPIFERANALGHKLVIVPSPRVRARTEKAAWQEFAARLNTAGEKAKAAGLGFGYHNHDAEFAAVEDTTPFAIITGTDASLVQLELDCYWAVKAGQDPLALFRTHGKRIVAIHVKDAGPAPERAMLPVGAGTIDFRAILDAGRKAGLRHWFIEHDNPGDAIASITASAAAMKAYK